MAARQRGKRLMADGDRLSRRVFLRKSALAPAAVVLGQAGAAFAGRYVQVYNWKKWGCSAQGGTQKGPAVAGRVVCGEKPLAGVRCSDGSNVVTTDADGRFAIDAMDLSLGYVFVVTPRGYGTDRFYVTAAAAAQGEVAFDLKALGTADKYTMAYLPDIHLGSGDRKVTVERFGATVAELNGMAPRPAFVLAGGDICLVSHVGDLYVEMMSKLKMPVRNGLGNHELFAGEDNPRGPYNELFGPTYYSFDYGRVHYVVLDGCLFVPQRRGLDIEGWVSPTELEWLENDLEHVPEGMPTVVSIHIPLQSTYPERRRMSAGDAALAVTRRENAEAVIAVLSRYDVPLVLQGHAHENERIFRGTIEFVESISVCGSWWKAKSGRELGVSGEPRGYRVLEVDGTRIKHRYVSSAESRTDAAGEFVGIGKTPLKASDELVVNLFDASNEAKVSGRVDGGAWKSWTRAKEGRYHLVTHHWKSPKGFLVAGEHRVEVRCQDREREDTTVAGMLKVS